MTGTVKAWFDEKGFGFITPDGGADDCYVHRTALTDGQTLVQGSPVTYYADWNAQKNKFTATGVTGAVPGDGKGKGGGKSGGDDGFGKSGGKGDSFRSEPYQASW